MSCVLCLCITIYGVVWQGRQMSYVPTANQFYFTFPTVTWPTFLTELYSDIKHSWQNSIRTFSEVNPLLKNPNFLRIHRIMFWCSFCKHEEIGKPKRRKTQLNSKVQLTLDGYLHELNRSCKIPGNTKGKEPVPCTGNQTLSWHIGIVLKFTVRLREPVRKSGLSAPVAERWLKIKINVGASFIESLGKLFHCLPRAHGGTVILARKSQPSGCQTPRRYWSWSQKYVCLVFRVYTWREPFLNNLGVRQRKYAMMDEAIKNNKRQGMSIVKGSRLWRLFDELDSSRLAVFFFRLWKLKGRVIGTWTSCCR